MCSVCRKEKSHTPLLYRCVIFHFYFHQVDFAIVKYIVVTEGEFLTSRKGASKRNWCWDRFFPAHSPSTFQYAKCELRGRKERVKERLLSIHGYLSQTAGEGGSNDSSLSLLNFWFSVSSCETHGEFMLKVPVIGSFQ